MQESLKPRNEIPVDLTWDLTDLFPDETSYETALAEIGRQSDRIQKEYQGEITSSTDPVYILNAVMQLEQLYILLGKAGNYAYLSVAVDMTDDSLVSRNMKFESLAAGIASQVSFFQSELMEADEQVLKKAAELDQAYAVFFSDILRQKKHKLEPETEKVLAALSPVLHLPYTVYEQTKHADMDFGSFVTGEKTYPLSFVLFENDYNLDADPDVRRTAFQSFSNTLRKYENTVATLYNGEVQKQKILSHLRGYASVFDYLLDEQKVDRALYDRQIDVIMTELAPHMRRYARLLQKARGLEKMTFADLKISLDPEYDPKVSIDESKDYVFHALGALGNEYRDQAMRAYDERWIDFAQNTGKSTGGFCSSPYGIHSYILLSWNDHLSEVFTLVHELGHAMHFLLANKAQPYFGCEPSLYYVEAPSTCNEMLLTHELMKRNPDTRFQRWVLASMIQNTYFHNFVTHLLEAAYQREVYRRVDRGEQLQAADFNAIMRSMLETFWGDAVEITEGAELTWMRQPHYYMGLYSYTYSAGLTIATEASQRILREGEPAARDWLAALKAGGSVKPDEFAALAGVDITREEPLRNTIAYIGRMIDKMTE